MPTDEAAVRALYDALISCWNRGDAEAMIARFANRTIMIGFDGCTLHGQRPLASTSPASFEKKAWRIELFPITCAAWHRREDDARAPTAELQAALEPAANT